MRRIPLVLIVTFALATVGVLATADATLTEFQPGTVIESAAVNANFAALNEGKQDRVEEECAAGSAIRAIAAEGGVTCEPVGGEGGPTYAAGDGLDLTDTTFSVAFPLTLSGGAPPGATDAESAALAGVNGDPAVGTFGVYGEAVQTEGGSTPATDAGVKGRGLGQAVGVLGEAGDFGDALRPLGAVGVVGIGSNRGVVGSSVAGSALYGISEGNYGLWAQSMDWRGATGRTDRADNNYGLYTPDNLFSSNINLMGGIMVVARNDGAALEPGAVVAFRGVERPLSRHDPATVRVAAAEGVAAAGVAGVVWGRFDLDAALDDGDGGAPLAAREIAPAGSVSPGEHLLLVIAGPAEVRVRAGARAIRPGDPLVVSAESGVAVRADEALVALRAGSGADGAVAALPAGAVFAKALEPLPAGREGMIYAFVTGF